MRESLKNYLLSLNVENSVDYLSIIVSKTRDIREHIHNAVPKDPFFYIFGPKYLAGIVIGGLFIDKGSSFMKLTINHILEESFTQAQFKG